MTGSRTWTKPKPAAQPKPSYDKDAEAARLRERQRRDDEAKATQPGSPKRSCVCGRCPRPTRATSRERLTTSRSIASPRPARAAWRDESRADHVRVLRFDRNAAGHAPSKFLHVLGRISFHFQPMPTRTADRVAVTTQELAALLGVHRVSVGHWARAAPHALSVRRGRGRSARFNVVEVCKWLIERPHWPRPTMRCSIRWRSRSARGDCLPSSTMGGLTLPTWSAASEPEARHRSAAPRRPREARSGSQRNYAMAAIAGYFAEVDEALSAIRAAGVTLTFPPIDEAALIDQLTPGGR